MSRPTTNPYSWATNANYSGGAAVGTPARVAPSGGLQAEGWEPGQEPGAQNFNALIGVISDWMIYAVQTMPVFTEVISPTLIAGGGTTVNNYAPTGYQAYTTTIRQDVGTAAGLGATITGLTGGVDGRIMIIHNIATATPGHELTITHDDAGSTAANRFYLPNNASIVIRNNASMTFRYDGTSSRWRAIASL